MGVLSNLGLQEHMMSICDGYEFHNLVPCFSEGLVLGHEDV